MLGKEKKGDGRLKITPGSAHIRHLLPVIAVDRKHVLTSSDKIAVWDVIMELRHVRVIDGVYRLFVFGLALKRVENFPSMLEKPNLKIFRQACNWGHILIVSVDDVVNGGHNAGASIHSRGPVHADHSDRDAEGEESEDVRQDDVGNANHVADPAPFAETPTSREQLLASNSFEEDAGHRHDIGA